MGGRGGNGFTGAILAHATAFTESLAQSAKFFATTRMSDIDIRHPNRIGLAQARSAVDQVARKLSDQFGVECEWLGDVLSFERSGVRGRIALDEHDVHVSAKLGFLLSAMKGPIEAEIRRVLAEKLGPAS